MARDRVPIAIPPGVSRAPSNTSPKVSGRWFESNLVRWVDGDLRPIGGWEKLDVTATASKIRAMHSWSDNSGIMRTALLCDGHVYVEDAGTLIDISPTPPLQAPSTDLFEGGYGDYDYSDDDYGTPRPDREIIRPVGPCFTVDNWGEDLLICSSEDGRLLRWTPSVVSAVATVVPNAPIGIRTFVVTPERHVIAFGISGSARSWGWCDREDIEDWNFADPLSTAGTYDVEPSAPIIAAKTMRYGTIFWTTKNVYFTRYVGLPFVYSVGEKIGTKATPLSAQSVVEYADHVIWPAEDGWWVFDGNNISPLPCDLLDWFRNSYDKIYLRYRISGTFLGAFPELWWFFPSDGSDENDRYICYHFYDRWWGMGKIRRTCGTPNSAVTAPLMTDGTNIFYHERGEFYHDAIELPYAETSAINLQKGSSMMTIVQCIIDNAVSAQSLLFDFHAKMHRVDGGSPAEHSKVNCAPRNDGYLDVGITGRDIRMRVRSSDNGVPSWSWGTMLALIARRGNR